MPSIDALIDGPQPVVEAYGYAMAITGGVTLAGRPALATPDVLITVEEGRVNAPQHRLWLVTPDSRLELALPGLCSADISRSSTIRVVRDESCPHSRIGRLLSGPLMAALVLQRGALPLHAVSVATDGGCWLLVGPSAVGKTTVGLALVREGWKIQSDDLAVVGLNGGVPWVSPGTGTADVWEPSRCGLPEVHDGLFPTLKGRVALGVYAEWSPLPVRGVVVLTVQRGPLSVRRLDSVEALGVLALNTHWRRAIRPLGREHTWMSTAAALAARPIFQLAFSRRPNEAEDVAGHIAQLNADAAV